MLGVSTSEVDDISCQYNLDVVLDMCRNLSAIGWARHAGIAIPMALVPKANPTQCSPLSI